MHCGLNRQSSEHGCTLVLRRDLWEVLEHKTVCSLILLCLFVPFPSNNCLCIRVTGLGTAVIWELVLPGLVVILGLYQLWVWPEDQLNLGRRAFFAPSQRGGGAAAVRLGPGAVVRGAPPFAARSGLWRGLATGVWSIWRGGVVGQVRTRISIILATAKSGVVTLLGGFLHTVVPEKLSGYDKLSAQHKKLQ